MGRYCLWKSWQHSLQLEKSGNIGVKSGQKWQNKINSIIGWAKYVVKQCLLPCCHCCGNGAMAPLILILHISKLSNALRRYAGECGIVVLAVSLWWAGSGCCPTQLNLGSAIQLLNAISSAPRARYLNEETKTRIAAVAAGVSLLWHWWVFRHAGRPVGPLPHHLGTLVLKVHFWSLSIKPLWWRFCRKGWFQVERLHMKDHLY